MTRVIRNPQRIRVVQNPQSVRVVRNPNVSRVILGSRGLTGKAGPGGVAEGFDYVQASPLSTWIVNHNQGKKPLVQVFDAGGNEVEAGIIHNGVNQTYLYFSSPFAGSARFV